MIVALLNSDIPDPKIQGLQMSELTPERIALPSLEPIRQNAENDAQKRFIDLVIKLKEECANKEVAERIGLGRSRYCHYRSRVKLPEFAELSKMALLLENGFSSNSDISKLNLLNHVAKEWFAISELLQRPKPIYSLIAAAQLDAVLNNFNKSNSSSATLIRSGVFATAAHILARYEIVPFKKVKSAVLNLQQTKVGFLLSDTFELEWLQAEESYQHRLSELAVIKTERKISTKDLAQVLGIQKNYYNQITRVFNEQVKFPNIPFGLLVLLIAPDYKTAEKLIEQQKNLIRAERIRMGRFEPHESSVIAELFGVSNYPIEGFSKKQIIISEAKSTPNLALLAKVKEAASNRQLELIAKCYELNSKQSTDVPSINFEEINKLEINQAFELIKNFKYKGTSAPLQQPKPSSSLIKNKVFKSTKLKRKEHKEIDVKQADVIESRTKDTEEIPSEVIESEMSNPVIEDLNKIEILDDLISSALSFPTDDNQESADVLMPYESKRNYDLDKDGSFADYEISNKDPEDNVDHTSVVNIEISPVNQNVLESIGIENGEQNNSHILQSEVKEEIVSSSAEVLEDLSLPVLNTSVPDIKKFGDRLMEFEIKRYFDSVKDDSFADFEIDEDDLEVKEDQVAVENIENDSANLTLVTCLELVNLLSQDNINNESVNLTLRMFLDIADSFSMEDMDFMRTKLIEFGLLTTQQIKDKNTTNSCNLILQDNPDLILDTEFLPTNSFPGSEEKQVVLIYRYIAGLPLWHPHDRDLDYSKK